MTDKAVQKKQPKVTRQQLLSVVGDIILEKGLSAVTLDAVSEASGVSKGGLLYHFPNKNALLEEFINEGSKAFTESVERASSDDPESTGRKTRAELRVVAGIEDRRKSCIWATLEQLHNYRILIFPYLLEFRRLKEEHDGTFVIGFAKADCRGLRGRRWKLC